MATTTTSTTTQSRNSTGTQSRNSTGAQTQARRPRSDASKVREGLTKARNGAVSYVRTTTERAVDVPFGAALIAADRVNEVIEPWTQSQAVRERELRSLRTRVQRELNKFERRGGTARRQATQRARRTRSRFQRELTQRRRSVTTTARQNRRKVERVLKQNRTRAERALQRAGNGVSDRANALV